MGIKGLTGVVAASHLGKRKIFDGPGEHEDVVIIDGSAFAYRVSKLHIPWTSGGENYLLGLYIAAYISAFRNVGLKPVFVWDGAFDFRKLSTVQSRLQGVIRNSISFMRASPQLRANGGFQAETSVLPVLCTRACIAHLRTLGAEQHFAGGEADPVIAEMAVARGAYISSSDSDFFVTCHGTKGYIPLDTLAFTYMQEPDPDEDASWSAVKRTKGQSLGRNSATKVESLEGATQLSCTVYTAQEVATRLSIRLAWLPLLAILAGNDYYTPPIWRSSGSPTGGAGSSMRRLEAIARAMGKCAGRSIAQSGVTSATVRPFLGKVISEVCDSGLLESQISDIVNKTLESLPQYQVSALHDSQLLPPDEGEESSPLSLFLPAGPHDPNALLKTRLLNAFENGNFDRSLMQIVSTGIFAPSPALEEPDVATCHVSCGRPIRIWIYAILHQSVGIYQPQREILDPVHDSGQGSDNEESSEAQLEEKAEMEMDDAASAEENECSEADAPFVTEYVRRSSALSAEQVAIPPIDEILPIQDERAILARSTSDRYSIFLRATSSDCSSLASPSGPHIAYLVIIAALRHLTFTFQDSALQAWTQAQRRAVLAMAYLIANGKAPSTGKIETVAIQRAAQVTCTISAIAMLVESLLLTPLIPPGELLFEGRLFHSFLGMGEDQVDLLIQQNELDVDAFNELVHRLEDGLPRSPQTARKLSKKEKRKLKETERKSADTKPHSQNPMPGNKFELLN